MSQHLTDPPPASSVSDPTGDHLASIPFMKVIGMTSEASKGETCVNRVALTPSLTAPGAPDTFANGVIAAAIDQAGSTALSRAVGHGTPMATVSLSITVLEPARGTTVTLLSQCVGVGHGLGHTLVRAVRPDGVVCAQGMVNYFVGAFPGGVASKDRMGTDTIDTVGGEPIHDLTGEDLAEAIGVIRPAPDQVIAPYRPNLVGSRDQVAFHGGVIALTAMEAAQSAASDLRLSHLVVDYLRAGQPTDLTATAGIIHRSRKTATVRIEVTQDGGQRHVATATARLVMDGPA